MAAAGGSEHSWWRSVIAIAGIAVFLGLMGLVRSASTPPSLGATTCGEIKGGNRLGD